MTDDLLRQYHEFTAALTRFDLVALSSLVDKPNFRAVLPGGPTEGLPYAQFIPEMERRRAVFPDMGQRVQIHRLVTGDDGNTIVAWYSMTVNNTGELRAMGSDAVVSPSGKEITFTSMDMITFDDHGRVTQMVVVSDRLPTVLAIGGLG